MHNNNLSKNTSLNINKYLNNIVPKNSSWTIPRFLTQKIYRTLFGLEYLSTFSHTQSCKLIHSTCDNCGNNIVLIVSCFYPLYNIYSKPNSASGI